MVIRAAHAGRGVLKDVVPAVEKQFRGGEDIQREDVDFADLVHWTLPLLVTGAYVPPLLVGHSRRMMHHDSVYLSICFFIALPWRFVGMGQEKMK